MELDELKNIWQKNRPGFQSKDEAELATMLKGNSKSVVDKLKKSAWFELIFTFLAGVAMLIYALTLPNGALKWTSVSILLLFVAYSVYYIKKILLLNRFNPGVDNLKETVQKLVDNLSSYLRFYKRSYSILYPIYFVLGLLFGALETGSEVFIAKVTNPKTLMYLIFWGGIFFFLSTWVTTWYLKKLYGNHLDKLKSLLSEFKSFEEEPKISTP
jgi:hypothetical protein